LPKRSFSSLKGDATVIKDYSVILKEAWPERVPVKSTSINEEVMTN
jgi:hypothetical protein